MFIALGRVVAVDWVVPKTQYEEAKLSSVQDSDADDHDEVQSSSSTDEQQSTAEQSDQDQTSVSNVVSEDDITTFSDDAVDKEETMSEQSEDEEESEYECKRNEMEDFTIKEKSHRKKKVTNDVTEGRTVFIRYTCLLLAWLIGNSYCKLIMLGIYRLILMKMICMICSLTLVILVTVR